MFDKATRLALRFESSKGLLTVEDLWNLPLTTKMPNKPSLDNVASIVIRKIKETEETSIVETHSTKNTELQLQLDILKHIVKVKQEENKNASQALENKAKKERLLRLLTEKKDAKDAELGIEELEKMIADL